MTTEADLKSFESDALAPWETALLAPFGTEAPTTLPAKELADIPEYAIMWSPYEDYMSSTDFCPRRPPRKIDDRNSWEFHGVIHSISARPAGENTYDGERDGGKEGDRGWVFVGTNGFGPAQHLFVSAPAARALGRLLLGLPQEPGDGELISETMERY